MKIWLDDQLNIPELKARHVPEGWVGARNFAEFKVLIEQAGETGETVDAIDFDNDLGEPMEGKHILNWLIDNYPETAIGSEMHVHSQNIEAKKELLSLIRDCKEHSQEILEKKNRPSYDELFGEKDGAR